MSPREEQRLVDAIARGDWDEVADINSRIRQRDGEEPE